LANDNMQQMREPTLTAMSCPFIRKLTHSPIHILHYAVLFWYTLMEEVVAPRRLDSCYDEMCQSSPLPAPPGSTALFWHVHCLPCFAKKERSIQISKNCARQIPDRLIELRMRYSLVYLGANCQVKLKSLLRDETSLNQRSRHHISSP
jgi:hypothetical protein